MYTRKNRYVRFSYECQKLRYILIVERKKDVFVNRLIYREGYVYKEECMPEHPVLGEWYKNNRTFPYSYFQQTNLSEMITMTWKKKIKKVRKKNN